MGREGRGGVGVDSSPRDCGMYVLLGQFPRFPGAPVSGLCARDAVRYGFS